MAIAPEPSRPAHGSPTLDYPGRAATSQNAPQMREVGRGAPGVYRAPRTHLPAAHVRAKRWVLASAADRVAPFRCVRTLGMPGGRSEAVNSANPGRGLRGRPARERPQPSHARTK